MLHEPGCFSLTVQALQAFRPYPHSVPETALNKGRGFTEGPREADSLWMQCPDGADIIGSVEQSQEKSAWLPVWYHREKSLPSCFSFLSVTMTDWSEETPLGKKHLGLAVPFVLGSPTGEPCPAHFQEDCGRVVSLIWFDVNIQWCLQRPRTLGLSKVLGLWLWPLCLDSISLKNQDSLLLIHLGVFNGEKF